MKKTIFRVITHTVLIAAALILCCWLTYLLSVPSLLRTAQSIAPDVEKHHTSTSWDKDADGKLTKEVPEQLNRDVVAIWEDRGFAFYLLSSTPYDARAVLVKAIDGQQHASEVVHLYGPRFQTHNFVVLPNGWAYWLHS